jgi:hypothetical protein
MISLPETNHDHLRTGQLKVTKDEFVQVQATALHLQMYSFSALKTLPTTENMPPTFMVEALEIYQLNTMLVLSW